MSDHEFEKKVQGKMDELKFRPSEAVWLGVEKKIRQDKRRRRILLWLPVLLLTLSAGGYLLFNGNFKKESTSLTANSTSTNPPTTIPSASTPAEPATTTTKKLTDSKEEKDINAVKENAAANKEPNSSNKQKEIAATDKNKQPVIKQQTDKEIIEKERQPVKRSVVAGNTVIRKKLTGKRQPRLKQQNIPVAEESGDMTTVDQPAAEKSFNSSSVLKDMEKWSINTSFPAPPVPAEKTTTEQPKQPIVRPVKKWQWGVEANGGFSNISENKFGDLRSIFGEQKSLVEDLSNNPLGSLSPTFNGSYISLNPPLSRQSAIRIGYAFSLGGFVQRPLSRKFSLSVGLQYAYFSAQTTVGQLTNAARVVNIGLNSSQVVDRYYAGHLIQNYTNRYHIIGIPVVVHFNLNKSKRTPVVLDGGVSISRLISSNALHYDGVSGIYYKDNSLFNRTQLGLTTGLNIGLLQKSKHPMWIGPSMRYSLTGLVKKNVSAGQYLWSTGLSVKMLLKK